MITSIRKINQSWNSVRQGNWDYIPYIGRQINHITIGVVGYGRLGKLFARYCKAFGAKVLIFDPYKSVKNKQYEQVSINKLLKNSDVISFHVHVNDETIEMVDEIWFKQMKSEIVLVNTSRGEIINEKHLIEFLKKNENAFYATDVIANEIKGKIDSPFKNWGIKSNRVLITPHIGGMTKEAQEIAYNAAAEMLKKGFSDLVK